MIKRRHSDQGRGLPAVKGTELRQPSQQRGAQHRPHPRLAVQQVVLLAPQLGAAHRAVDVTVQMLEPLAQIVDMAADLALQSPGRVFEPVFLGDDHLQQVVAPRAQRAQLAVCSSGSVRTLSSARSAYSAKSRASMRSVLASCPIALANERTQRGLSNATGSPAACSAASTRGSYPPG